MTKKESIDGATHDKPSGQTPDASFQPSGSNNSMANPGNDGLGEQPSYAQQQISTHQDEKRRLAEYAVKKFIRNGLSVLLDSGSTVAMIAKRIFEKEEEEPGSSLSLITNNMLVFADYHRENKEDKEIVLPKGHSLNLILLGGEYDRAHEALLGIGVAKALEQVYPNLSIIGVSGIDTDQLYCFGSTPLHTAKVALVGRRVETRLVVCDHSKIGHTDALSFCSWDKLVEGAERCVVLTAKPKKQEQSGNVKESERRFGSFKEGFLDWLKTRDAQCKEKGGETIDGCRVYLVRLIDEKAEIFPNDDRHGLA